MLSHAVCFRHFWTPYFVKGISSAGICPLFSSSNPNDDTPSDTNPHSDGTLEDFHWITNYGGAYTGWGPIWESGVTPLIHTDSTRSNQRSFAITYENGRYQEDQIEAYFNHGVTPPAFGWMYQGSPAGADHIAIVYSWGESSATYQSTVSPIGVTPRCRPDTKENIFNIEHSGWITDYSRGNHPPDFSLGDILLVVTIRNIMIMKDIEIQHIFMIGE